MFAGEIKGKNDFKIYVSSERFGINGKISGFNENKKLLFIDHNLVIPLKWIWKIETLLNSSK